MGYVVGESQIVSWENYMLPYMYYTCSVEYSSVQYRHERLS